MWNNAKDPFFQRGGYATRFFEPSIEPRGTLHRDFWGSCHKRLEHDRKGSHCVIFVFMANVGLLVATGLSVLNDAPGTRPS